MKRKLKLIVLVFSLMLVTISAQYLWDFGNARRVVAPYNEADNKTRYEFRAEFLEETMTLRCKGNISYTNKEDKPLKNICLHLYPNAFQDKDKVPFEIKEMEKAYPNGFDPGYIEIESLKKAKKALDYRIMGESSTIMRVTPARPIEPGDEIQMTVEFMVKLPNTIGRMGYGGNTVNITNWFPILAVYDDRGWHLDPYYAIGDPFYSDVSNYSMVITLPKEYKMGVTGNIIKTKQKKEKKVYEVLAEDVRDFVMILSKNFDIKETMAGDTRVLSYSIGGLKGEEALQYGKESLEIFNYLFGIYPYEQLSIVACDFFIGGMEYPNLVMISKDLYEIEGNFPLEYVIAHEVAHQWWYGIVGNNEIDEPWLDEALTEYATLMYFEKKYGPHIKEQVFEKMIQAQYENYLNFEPDKGEKILRSLKEFDSSWQYSSIVYSKGAIFISELRRELGDEIFLKTLRQYFQTFKFKNATTEDFRNICQENSDKDLTDLFNKWLNGVM